MNLNGAHIKGRGLKRLQWIKKTTKEQGSITEAFACNFLKSEGLAFVERNFTCKLGEIDLIMEDSGTLVFVEVKYRKSIAYGTPVEAVSFTKQQKITKTAQYYLQQQGINAYNTDCRFDVVGIQGPQDNYQVNWLKNAF